MESRKWLSGDKDEIVTYQTSQVKIRFSGICPHFGGPLSYRKEHGGFICPWHDWHFDKEGKCINRNVSCRVKIYDELSVEGPNV
jgi:nitrite reductase/ring-hydroxylating ferredoxin subunit